MKKILKKSKGVSEKCSKSNNFCQHSTIRKKNSYDLELELEFEELDELED